MLTHMLRQTPADGSADEGHHGPRHCRAERDGEVLNASVFGGFPLADIPHVGLAVVIVADERRLDAGQSLLDELSAMAWSRRADFVLPIEPMSSRSRARKRSRTLHRTGDHGDNCGAAGSPTR